MTRLGKLPALVRVADTRTARPAPKVAAAHYQTDGHKDWAAQVIARAGGTCQGSGCGRTGIRLYADHIVELRDGGAPLDLTNGQALCGRCHTTKTVAARAARQASRPEGRGG